VRDETNELSVVEFVELPPPAVLLVVRFATSACVESLNCCESWRVPVVCKEGIRDRQCKDSF